MSVIVAGMTMPESCRDCALWMAECKIGGECDRNNDCPLCSVDSVIEQMEAEKLKGGAIEIAFNMGIDACIAILRGLEGKQDDRRTESNS